MRASCAGDHSAPASLLEASNDDTEGDSPGFPDRLIQAVMPRG